MRRKSAMDRTRECSILLLLPLSVCGRLRGGAVLRLLGPRIAINRDCHAQGKQQLLTGVTTQIIIQCHEPLTPKLIRRPQPRNVMSCVAWIFLLTTLPGLFGGSVY